MPTYSVSKIFGWKGKITKKVSRVCRMFGLTADRLTERRVCHNCTVQINAGDIVYITGPSRRVKRCLYRSKSTGQSQRRPKVPFQTGNGTGCGKEIRLCRRILLKSRPDYRSGDCIQHTKVRKASRHDIYPGGKSRRYVARFGAGRAGR